MKKAFNKAENELIAAGWTKVCTTMASGTGLKYGALFVCNGQRFYLNKDTLMMGFTGPGMAQACAPLFN